MPLQSLNSRFCVERSIRTSYAGSMSSGLTPYSTALGVALAVLKAEPVLGQTNMIFKPGLFHSLTEPPCSYCSTQNRKGLVRNEDRVIAWIRGAHNGGAIPIRHFLSAPRVINDTYGLFFYDPDGGYVSAFKKDKGYEFQGWRDGIMVVRGPDGTLWTALGGWALEGPRKGQRLERQPSFLTEWGYWLMLHPESTAYNLFDGKRYPVVDLPVDISPEAKATMGHVDSRHRSRFLACKPSRRAPPFQQRPGGLTPSISNKTHFSGATWIESCPSDLSKDKLFSCLDHETIPGMFIARRAD